MRTSRLFRSEHFGHYPAAPAVSPAAHSPCPQLHAMDGLLADPSQYAPQYLLPGAAGQLQPGCAHLSDFFSAMTKPPCPPLGSTARSQGQSSALCERDITHQAEMMRNVFSRAAAHTPLVLWLGDKQGRYE